MKTVVLDPPPAEVQQLIETRRRLRLDVYDEIWEGVYHMAPAPHPRHGNVEIQLAVLLDPFANAAGLSATGPFNLGKADDFRVPDQGYHRALPETTFAATVAVAVEVISPGDETSEKLPFYAAHGVDEVLMVDPVEHRVSVLLLVGGRYQPADRSVALDVDTETLQTGIRWP